MKPSLVLIGLGNPGKGYESTRHNAGFLAMDRLSKEFGAGEWQEKQKFLASVQEARVVTVPILLVKPQTFMNRSGESVHKIVEFYKLNPAEQILIICDDIDIPLGEWRLRQKGGPGTHNGLKSIAATFGEEYPRLRIGIGPQPSVGDLAAWVLSVPSKEEQAKLQTTLEALPDLIRTFILERQDGES